MYIYGMTALSSEYASPEIDELSLVETRTELTRRVSLAQYTDRCTVITKHRRPAAALVPIRVLAFYLAAHSSGVRSEKSIEEIAAEMAELTSGDTSLHDDIVEAVRALRESTS
jgi:antitoxin (DNA-binding transcriptional repressor) of toxin-antitoxin stability system